MNAFDPEPVTLPPVDEIGDVLAYIAPGDVAFKIIAPFFAGYMAQGILYGFGLMMYLHHRHTLSWDQEGRGTRLFMTIIVLLNTILTGLNYAECIYWGSAQRRSIEGLTGYTWMDVLPPFFQGVIAALVQSYLARRSMKVVANRWAKAALFVVFATLIFVAWLGSIGLIVANAFYASHRGDELGVFNSNINMAVWATISAFVDCLISGVLALKLRREIRGFNQVTDSVLKRIIGVALRTAAYTAFFAVVAAVLALVFRTSLEYGSVFFPFVMFLPSLYVISLFTTLEARENLRRGSTAHPTGNTGSGSSAMSPLGRPIYQAGNSMPVVPIQFRTASQPGEQDVEKAVVAEPERDVAHF